MRRRIAFAMLAACFVGCGDSTAVPSSTDEPCAVAPGERGFVEEVVAPGGGTACARYSSGEVWCWGSNREGGIGEVRVEIARTPVRVEGLPCAVEVGCAGAKSCARAASGRAYVWGNTFQDEFGSSAPTPIKGVEDAVQVTSTAALRQDGRVTFWDWWHWDMQAAHEPVQYEPVGIVSALPHRGYARCFVMPDRTVRCWGENVWGAVGDGTYEPRVEPVPVVGLTDVVELVAEENMACALVADGRVLCWGQGGILGNDDVKAKPAPTPVIGIDDATFIATGGCGGCAIRGDKSMWCWGSSWLDGNASFPVPQRMDELEGVIDIAVGCNNWCALLEDRSVWCLGENDVGQLGHGVFEYWSAHPVRVALPGP